MIRREFDITPKVSIQQFLSVGYTLNKAELTCIIVNKVIESARQNTRLGPSTSSLPSKPDNTRFKQSGNNSQSRFSADRSVNWEQEMITIANKSTTLLNEDDDEDANPIQFRPNPSKNVNNTFSTNVNVNTNTNAGSLNKKPRVPSANHAHQSNVSTQNKKTTQIPPNIQKNIKVVRHDAGSSSKVEPELNNHNNNPA